MIDGLLIAFDAHMFSHGYWPGTCPKAQKWAPWSGPSSFWALVLGPGPISIMAECMCIKGNQ